MGKLLRAMRVMTLLLLLTLATAISAFSPVMVSAQTDPVEAQDGSPVVIVEENPIQDWILVAVVFALAFVIWTQQTKLTQLSDNLLNATPEWAADILRDVIGGGTDQLVNATQRTSIEWDDRIAEYIDQRIEKLLKREQPQPTESSVKPHDWDENETI